MFMNRIAMNLKLLLLGGISLSMSLGCQQDIAKEISSETHKGYTIAGTIINQDAAMLYLVDSKEQIVDSTAITNSSFVLKGTVVQPDSYNLVFKNQLQPYAIIVENTSFKVFINQDQMMIAGGDLNTKLTAFQKNEDMHNEHRLTALNSFATKLITEKALHTSLDSISKMESQFAIRFIEENQDNLLSSIGLAATDLQLDAVLSLSENTKDAKNTHLVNTISENLTALQKEEDIRNTALAKEAEVKDVVEKVYRAPAPYFTGESLNGSDLAFANVLKGKKAVLIDFWASWCKPCRMITPQVRAIHQRYRDLGFDVITVSLDKNRAAWKQGVLEDQMSSWNHIYDESKDISYSYSVRAIPHMVLVDGEGRIIENKISITKLKSELTKIFK